MDWYDICLIIATVMSWSWMCWERGRLSMVRKILKGMKECGS